MEFALTPQLQLLLIIGFTAMALGFIAWVIRSALSENKTLTRRLAGHSPTASAKRPAQKDRRNLIAVFGQHLSLPDAQEISRIRFQLAQAGFFTAKSIPIYYGARVLSLILPLLVLLVYWGVFARDIPAEKISTFACALIVAGLFAPTLFLKARIRKRIESAREGFPDMMDLLVACIEAGLGLDAALMNVSKELGDRFPVLKINLDLMNLELLAGRPRREAMKNFAERTALDEAKAMAVMLRQAEEMGSSLGNSLRTFSDEMRSKRMLRAEEKALALSAKLTVPLIFFIFPTIMVMLLLPAGVRLGGAL